MKEDVVYLLGFKDAKYTAEKELEKNPCAVNAQKVFEYSKRIDEVLVKIDKDYDELNKYKELQKGLGCPLEVFIKLQEYPHIYTDRGVTIPIILTRSGLWWYAVYDNEYTDVKYPLSDYKKTWWLKEDRSE